MQNGPRTDWEALLEGYVRGDLSEGELRQLEVRLAEDPEARRRFRRWMRLDANLNRVAAEDSECRVRAAWRGAGGGLGAEFEGVLGRADGGAVVARKRSFWAAWSRPFWAAAAGLVFGLSGASALWAYAGSSVAGIWESVIGLVAEDFERPGMALGVGFPREFGQWSGDTAAVVEARGGVLPLSGRRMLRLVRTDYPGEASPRSRSSNEMMVLDLREHAEWIASGRAWLQARASFRVSGLLPEESVSAGLDVFGYAEDPRERGARSWSTLREEHLGMAAKRRPMKADASRWETVQAGMDLPPDTRFVLIHLVVSNNRPAHEEGGVEFSGAYVDDVSVQLRKAPVGGLRAGRLRE
ncbi:MAG: hypothetical protein RLZZ142_1022 [Verrucomicrobiota bacterium]